MKYKVAFTEVQNWVYVYEVEAGSEMEAHKLAIQKFENGEDSLDNYVDDSRLAHSEVLK